MISKKILFVVENGFVSRSFLRSDFLFFLKKEFKEIVVLAPVAKLVGYKKRYEKDNVVFDAIKETEDGWLKKKFYTLLKYSIPSKEAKFKLMKNIFQEDGYRFNTWTFYFLPVFLSWFLSRFKFWRCFLRKIYSFFKIDGQCLDILAKYKPDIVFANYTGVFTRDFNLKLLRAAKKEGVITVGNIASWDQLYSKVFITEQTDFLNVHNQIIKKEAVRLGDFQEERVFATGIPHFDFYFKKDLLLSKKEFFSSINANPDKKLIIYFNGLANEKINDEHFIDFFDKLTKEKSDCQVYFRPHPKALFSQDLINGYQNNNSLIFEKKSEDLIGKYFELRDNDEILLFNLLFYCSLVVCFSSTVIIEACLLDRPVINILYNGRNFKNRYYRFKNYLGKEHLRQIFAHSCLRICFNNQDLEEAISVYLMRPFEDKKGREKVVKDQVFLSDGDSAKTLAYKLKEIAWSF